MFLDVAGNNLGMNNENTRNDVAWGCLRGSGLIRVYCNYGVQCRHGNLELWRRHDIWQGLRDLGRAAI